MHFFLSDLHLGLGSQQESREREQLLVRFLDHVGSRNAETLWIVGDLFDFWFDYRTVVPRHFVRSLGALAALSDAGVTIEYLMGNHDFGHRDFFEKEIGATVYPGDVERTIGGRKVYISHGDGKAFNDTGYKILKKVLRSRLSNVAWRLLHPDIGIGLAARASRRSRDHTNEKHYGGEQPGEADGLEVFAREKIEKEGFDLVVMGHSHRFRDERYEGGGRYINLGDWMKGSGRYLVVGDEVEVCSTDDLPR